VNQPAACRHVGIGSKILVILQNFVKKTIVTLSLALRQLAPDDLDERERGDIGPSRRRHVQLDDDGALYERNL
jgi:hypothetical protein